MVASAILGLERTPAFQARPESKTGKPALRILEFTADEVRNLVEGRGPVPETAEEDFFRRLKEKRNIVEDAYLEDAWSTFGIPHDGTYSIIEEAAEKITKEGVERSVYWITVTGPQPPGPAHLRNMSFRFAFHGDTGKIVRRNGREIAREDMALYLETGLAREVCGVPDGYEILREEFTETELHVHVLIPDEGAIQNPRQCVSLRYDRESGRIRTPDAGDKTRDGIPEYLRRRTDTANWKSDVRIESHARESPWETWMEGWNS